MDDYGTMDTLFKKQKKQISTPGSMSKGHQQSVLAHRTPGTKKPHRQRTPKPRMPKKTSGGGIY